MTKVTLWNNKPVPPKGKPIEFIKYMTRDGKLTKASYKPNDWINVQLLRKGQQDYDLIIAWDEEDKEVFVYLGNWNEGVVE